MMINKNLDRLIFAVNYDDMNNFHVFMRGFKMDADTFNKYSDFLCEKIESEKDFLQSFDFFVYVPSENSQKINFSMKLAIYLSQKLNKPLNAQILRKIRTTKELKMLPRDERYEEIQNSFAASLKGGERICVVDDALYSGATLNEISGTLKKAGALYVSGAVVAVCGMCCTE
jgi:predicted amidophosphoribosyltransferase